MGRAKQQARKSGSKPVNQHWVPKFYLRYFATAQTRSSESPQVWIFSKRDEDGDEKLTHTRNVCAKRFLYTPLQEDGSRNWKLEDQLGVVETLLSSRWPEFADGYVALDDKSVRMGLSLFVAIMHTRNPVVREQVERMHQQLLASMADVPLRPDGIPDVDAVEINGKTYDVDTSGWKDFRAWGKNEHDRLFADVVRSEAGRIAKALMTKRWSIVFSESDVFITSDKPVSMSHPDRKTFGVGTSGVVLTFPLGPKRMLVMDDLHHEPANQYYPLKPENAAAFNMTIWHGASRFMITGRPVPQVLEEIVSLDGG